MKRELKHIVCRIALDSFNLIAEPIPMKRELKLQIRYVVAFHCSRNCRAYPDEKGIETLSPLQVQNEKGISLQSLSR